MKSLEGIMARFGGVPRTPDHVYVLFDENDTIIAVFQTEKGVKSFMEHETGWRYEKHAYRGY